MMFENGSNLIGLHMEKVEFHVLFKIQQIRQFSGFQDSLGLTRLQCFHWILSCKRVSDSHLFKNTKFSIYFGVDC